MNLDAVIWSYVSMALTEGSLPECQSDATVINRRSSSMENMSRIDCQSDISNRDRVTGSTKLPRGKHMGEVFESSSAQPDATITRLFKNIDLVRLDEKKRSRIARRGPE
jgi:hypothetical protein